MTHPRTYAQPNALFFNGIADTIDSHKLLFFLKLSTARPSETMKISGGIQCRVGDYLLEIHQQLRENEPMAGKLSESQIERPGNH
jgi:hypothetical protein